jgi:hypothetical protein
MLNNRPTRERADGRRNDRERASLIDVSPLAPFPVVGRL